MEAPVGAVEERMVGWVRYSMWDRWRDLTRFRLACEMSLASYRTYVNDFPVTSEASLTVHDPSGDSGFKCGLDDFKTVLNDAEALYRTIYPSHVALVEDLARELVERLLVDVAGMGSDEYRPWDQVADDPLVERLLLEMQGAARVALTGSDAPGLEVVLPIPEAAAPLLNLLASVLEPVPACGTPQGIRRVAEAAGKELAVLMRGIRAIRTGSPDAPLH